MCPVAMIPHLRVNGAVDAIFSFVKSVSDSGRKARVLNVGSGTENEDDDISKDINHFPF
jgi:hypothetical protein